ncbi:hypothetical protein [Psychroflexus sp. ALD_RP9]|uniref:hypothetical protein n=1 Tax=Psychroflexus sp. ALD_RP9 TaxID=2777186 RepID=UPI001A8FC981|nr:hypothetical protein [Psychroflexus sp. ALD_RP9]QSS96741.1 hypothetical protein IMZ30_09850 [Psychroflexus sp. ALD_RP9]
MHKLLLYIFSCLIFQLSVASQVDSTSAEQQELIYDDSESSSIEVFEPNFKETYLDQDAFNYTEVAYKESSWQSFKNWLNLKWNEFLEWLLPKASKSSFWDILGTILKFLLIIGIITLIIWLFIKYNPGQSFVNSSNNSELNWTEDDYLIQKEDLTQLITQAKTEEDFRLATRYYFLETLKRLKNADLIKYEAEKTNASYIKELSGNNLNSCFAEAVRFYEYVWYGDFEINNSQFNQVEALFVKMFNQLKPKAHA